MALLQCMQPAEAAAAATPQIHEDVTNGVTFRHFELSLSSANTLLPDDPRIHREPLDETSPNFDYGQFEVFVPASELHLKLGCKSYYIVRMPMTLEREKVADLHAKQELFRAIKKVVESRTGAVRVVLEIPYERGCNLFFRTGSDDRYLDYLGPLRR